MKKALVIAFYFPPEGGGGTQRVAKFAKYLLRHGWGVKIVAAATQGRSLRGGNKYDPSLTSELGDVPVVRVPVPDEPWQRPVLDKHQAWGRGALDAAAEEWKTGEYSVVLITMSPFSLAHVGDALRTRLGAPVVYDLRDPWTLDGWPVYRHAAQWWSHRRFMRRTLTPAAGVIANTPEAGRCIARTLPGLPAERLTVIPNGYDAEDFEGLSDIAPDPSVFTLALTGSVLSGVLYPPKGLVKRAKKLAEFRAERMAPEGRTLKFLLDAVRLLRERKHPLVARLRVVVAGSNDEATARSVRESGVAEQVNLMGYLPHAESVRWLRRADALFLPLHDLPIGARSRIVPGKTYEYLASGRPILGCLPHGDARDLVERSGVGYIARPTDAHEIAERLDEMLTAWSAGRLPGGPAPWVAEYERAQQALALGRFLDRVTGATDSPAPEHAPEGAPAC